MIIPVFTLTLSDVCNPRLQRVATSVVYALTGKNTRRRIYHEELMVDEVVTSHNLNSSVFWVITRREVILKLTFRDYLSIPSSRVKSISTLGDGTNN